MHVKKCQHHTCSLGGNMYLLSIGIGHDVLNPTRVVRRGRILPVEGDKLVKLVEVKANTRSSVFDFST